MNNKKKTKQVRSYLQDKGGTFLGFTDQKTVVFNEFVKTKDRKRHNTVVLGDMGYGKSILLKKQIRSMYEKGNFVRGLDVTVEFQDVTHEFGGKVIRCNGEDGILNPLEILQAAEDEDTNFTRHLIKLTTFYCCYAPDAENVELCILGNLLRAFYAKWSLTPEGVKQITKLPADRYPILSDLLAFLDEQIREICEKAQVKPLMKIKAVFTDIVLQNGRLFDGYTTMEDVKDCKIVTYDFSLLKNMEPAGLDAMFLNLVSLSWAHGIENGISQKEQYEFGQLAKENRTNFLIMIDESHRWINTKKPRLLDLIMVYLQEAEKFFGGFTLTAPSILDFMPNGLDGLSINKLKPFFHLIQYRFIFHQNPAALPYLDEVLGVTLTSAQRSAIPGLDAGNALLFFTNVCCLNLHIYSGIPKKSSRPVGL